MKIFLSAIENAMDTKAHGSQPIAYLLAKNGVRMRWNLMSFFYMRNKQDLACFVRDNSEEVLIDSGAHSFQKGKQVDWEQYTDEYAQFIRRFDRPNVLGYFEMDVDNVLGYDKVLLLRKKLEFVSDKIIPVWHKNRGIDDFKKMCQQHQGRIVAITGFKNEDILDHQYPMFVKYAHEQRCKIHCLGMTRKPILEAVPFDYTDSSSWVQNTLYGKIRDRRVTHHYSTVRRGEAFVQSYLAAMERQEYFYRKWQCVCKD